MRRVLLVLEDYNELLFLETLLKKVGFNVDSIQNENALADKLVEYPDLVIATGAGHKINGVRVSKKVKKGKGSTKLLLLYSRQKLPEKETLDAKVVDAVAETPLNPRTILSLICHLTGIVPDMILSKFERLPIAKDFPAREGIQVISGAPSTTATSPRTSSGVVSGSAKLTAVDANARRARYIEFLKNVPPSHVDGFKKSYIDQELDLIRKDGESEAMKKLDEDRQDFVKKLFKK